MYHVVDIPTLVAKYMQLVLCMLGLIQAFTHIFGCRTLSMNEFKYSFNTQKMLNPNRTCRYASRPSSHLI